MRILLLSICVTGTFCSLASAQTVLTRPEGHSITWQFTRPMGELRGQAFPIASGLHLVAVHVRVSRNVTVVTEGTFVHGRPTHWEQGQVRWGKSAWTTGNPFVAVHAAIPGRDWLSVEAGFDISPGIREASDALLPGLITDVERAHRLLPSVWPDGRPVWTGESGNASENWPIRHFYSAHAAANFSFSTEAATGRGRLGMQNLRLTNHGANTIHVNYGFSANTPIASGEVGGWILGSMRVTGRGGVPDRSLSMAGITASYPIGPIRLELQAGLPLDYFSRYPVFGIGARAGL